MNKLLKPIELFQQKLGFIQMQQWAVEDICAERDSRTVEDYWDEGKLDLWSPERWESCQGLSRWIRAQQQQTPEVYYWPHGPLTGAGLTSGKQSLFSELSRGLMCFFQVDNEMKQFFSFFFSPPALGDRRVHIRYLLYLLISGNNLWWKKCTP